LSKELCPDLCDNYLKPNMDRALLQGQNLPPLQYRDPSAQALNVLRITMNLDWAKGWKLCQAGRDNRLKTSRLPCGRADHQALLNEIPNKMELA
jgi:hypothetical protein